MNWISIEEKLPKPLQTVWMTNGKGFTSLGCLIEYEGGYHWAITNGVIYEENGEIMTEAESDDYDVLFWHPVPKILKID